VLQKVCPRAGFVFHDLQLPAKARLQAAIFGFIPDWVW
jgi:hypothetical protein